MDHSIFWFDGFYYLVSIHLYPDDRFVYARSTNFCTWEELSPILDIRTPGSWDERSIWAPYVFEESGTYYMFYTGVTLDFTQSILLATSTNPADPGAWQTQGVVFQPSHEGMVWQPQEWANCRDPMVLEDEGRYLLYYTGLDESGGIVGVAEADSLSGPWEDQGTILPPNAENMLESPTLVHKGATYYLFYNEAYIGGKYHTGSGPLGPWQSAQLFRPGWAHEIWQDISGEWHTSYLTDYTVTISPVFWESFANPPLPMIGDNIGHRMLPLVIQ